MGETARASCAQRALECGGLTPLFVFQSFNVAKAFRDFRAFRGLKKRRSSAALQNIRIMRVIRGSLKRKN
jgi:hypothetical protein